MTRDACGRVKQMTPAMMARMPRTTLEDLEPARQIGNRRGQDNAHDAEDDELYPEQDRDEERVSTGRATTRMPTTIERMPIAILSPVCRAVPLGVVSKSLLWSRTGEPSVVAIQSSLGNMGLRSEHGLGLGTRQGGSGCADDHASALALRRSNST